MKNNRAAKSWNSVSFNELDDFLKSFKRIVREKSCSAEPKVVLKPRNSTGRAVIRLKKLQKGISQSFTVVFEKKKTWDKCIIAIPITEGRLNVYSVFSRIMASEFYHHYHHVITPLNVNITIGLGEFSFIPNIFPCFNPKTQSRRLIMFKRIVFGTNVLRSA